MASSAITAIASTVITTFYMKKRGTKRLNVAWKGILKHSDPRSAKVDLTVKGDTTKVVIVNVQDALKIIVNAMR